MGLEFAILVEGLGTRCCRRIGSTQEDDSSVEWYPAPFDAAALQEEDGTKSRCANPTTHDVA